MRWQDEGLLLSITRHGEGSARLTILTSEHGLCNGLARALKTGKSSASFPPLGTKLAVGWSARLDSHLGYFQIESLKAQAAKLFDFPHALLALQSLCALCETAMPEREPCREFYNDVIAVSECIDRSEKWFGKYLRWESRLLAICGFGLDLSRCCTTGSSTGLLFLSPRTGRAISVKALENPQVAPYRSRLLSLPPVLLENASEDSIECMSPQDWYDGLRVLSFFLNKFISPMPPARLQLLAAAQHCYPRPKQVINGVAKRQFDEK